MFSELAVLANDIALQTGRAHLFGCLYILVQACLPSKKGMNSVIQEMDKAKVPWSVTVMNIILLFYLKMRVFTQLGLTFSDFARKHVRPDIIKVRILYDAHNVGLDWSFTLKTWRKYGYLENSVGSEDRSARFFCVWEGAFP